MDFLRDILAAIHESEAVIAIDFNQWPRHTSSSLELLARISLEGRRSIYVNYCDAYWALLGSMYPPKAIRSILGDDFGRLAVKSANHALGTNIEVWDASTHFNRHLPLNEEAKRTLKEFSRAQTRIDLTEIKFRESDIGWAVASTLHSLFKVSELNLKRHRHLLARLATDYIQTYESVRTLFNNNSIGALIVFNGRFVHERAALRVAESMGIPVIFHESLEFGSHFYADNFPVHSRDKFAERAIELARLTSDETEIFTVGENWFNRRRDRNDPNLTRWTRRWSQGRDFPPYASTPGAQRAVIFTSSDDEFIGIGPEWELPRSATQIYAVSRASQELTAKGFQVTLRLHPNLSFKSKRMLRLWKKQAKKLDLKIVPPKSDIDSYSLLSGCDLVVTCGSTIGAEAAACGKPVMSLGSSIFDGIVKVPKYEPFLNLSESLAEAFDASSIEKRRLDSLVYGFFEATRGIPRILPGTSINQLSTKTQWRITLVEIGSRIFRAVIGFWYRTVIS